MQTRLALVLFALCLLAGCARRDEPQLLAGRVVTQAELRRIYPNAHFSDESYAVVRSDWLAWHQAQFEQAMYDLGNPMKYEARADCNRFAAKWAADAQARYLASAWHSGNAGAALAIGEVWIDTPAGYHAAVLALTERGWVCWEPQQTAQHERPVPSMVGFGRF